MQKQSNDETASTVLARDNDDLVAKEVAKAKLQREMARDDISAEEKNKLAFDLLKQEAKRMAEAKNSAKVVAYEDKVMLGVDGWKMRYYTNKFLVTDPNDVPEFIKKIKQSYIEGL